MNLRLTPERLELLHASFARVLEHSALTSSLFYERLFELDPSLRGLFHADLESQRRKLIEMLDVVLGDLTRLEVILPAVQRLSERHSAYGVEPAHFATAGAALIWALEQTQGERFTPETRAAWLELYTWLTGTMLGAASRDAVAVG